MFLEFWVPTFAVVAALGAFSLALSRTERTARLLMWERRKFTGSALEQSSIRRARAQQRASIAALDARHVDQDVKRWIDDATRAYGRAYRTIAYWCFASDALVATLYVGFAPWARAAGWTFEEFHRVEQALIVVVVIAGVAVLAGPLLSAWRADQQARLLPGNLAADLVLMGSHTVDTSCCPALTRLIGTA